MKSIKNNIMTLVFNQITCLIVLVFLVNVRASGQDNPDSSNLSKPVNDTLDHAGTFKEVRRFSFISNVGVIFVNPPAGNGSGYNGIYFCFGYDIPTGKNWSIQTKFNFQRRYWLRETNEFVSSFEILLMPSYKWNLDKVFISMAFGLGVSLNELLNFGKSNDSIYLNLALNIGYNLDKRTNLTFGIRKMVWGFSELGGNFIDFGVELKVY